MIHARVLGRAAEWRRRCSSCGAGDSRFVGCIEVKRRIFDLLIEFQIVRTLVNSFRGSASEIRGKGNDEPGERVEQRIDRIPDSIVDRQRR